ATRLSHSLGHVMPVRRSAGTPVLTAASDRHSGPRSRMSACFCLPRLLSSQLLLSSGRLHFPRTRTSDPVCFGLLRSLLWAALSFYRSTDSVTRSFVNSE